MHRIIYYYQTFINLNLLIFFSPVTHIHLSSIHFGINNDSSPYIHLNDYPPDNIKFDNVWHEMELTNFYGIKNVLMVGGAGGGYKELFSDFDTYYNLLNQTINKYPIDGIDLDIEEPVKLKDVKKLIRQIDKDHGKNFIISMAPVSYALKTDNIGLGNFSYKDLLRSPEGQRVNYFNGQFYGDFNLLSYDQAIQNDYPADKLVIGMLAGTYNYTFQNIYNTVRNISNKYTYFGGVFVWEYFNSLPNNEYPLLWSFYMQNAMNNESFI